MSLICIASYCTEENGRLKYAKRCMHSLLDTVDFNKHRLGVYLNAPSDEAKKFYDDFVFAFESRFNRNNLIIIENEENVGTAKAVTALMAKGTKDDFAYIKADDDFIVNKIGWVDEMEDAARRFPNAGVIALKRRDLTESTYRTDWAKSTLIEVPHKAGEKWYHLESVNACIGTCMMITPAAIEKVGALTQRGVYGLDDSKYSYRCMLVGLLSCYLCGVDIEHIDEGGDAYSKWKQEVASEVLQTYQQDLSNYKLGIEPIYAPFE